MTDALTRLADSVEAGNRHGLNRTMAEIGQPSDAWPLDWMSRMDAAYDGSLDAAKALHDAVLPGWEWHLGPSNAKIYPYNGSPLKSWSGMADTPARAWLMAIIRALAQVQG